MSIDEFSEGDILYRINSQCLVGGISDEDFRNNAQSLLEDIRGYFMGRYEVMAEFRPPQMDGCIACHDDLNARIAELTSELSATLLALEVCQDSRTELTAEVARYKKALEIIAQYDDGYAIPANDGSTRIDIARNALKDGV
jgi:hypothetical protein